MSSKKSSRGSSGYGSGDSQSGYGGGYGYGNSAGYGYGYGYGGGGGDTVAHRSLKDYVAILRERMWYIVIAFVLTMAAVCIYTFSRTPIWESSATVEIFRRNPNVMNVQQVMDSEVKSAEDLNTQVNILKSTTIIQRVYAQLKGDELKRFLAPYEKKRSADAKPLDPLEIMEMNRDIVPQRLSLVVAIAYQHPDRELAARIANLFADEYIGYTARARVDESLKAVEELEGRATEQRKKVDDMARALQAYREKNNLVSLDQRKDISTETLKALNLAVTQSGVELQTAETRWKQVMTARQAGADLQTLSFIATDLSVSRLQQQVTDARLAVTKLSERYRAGHPQMIAATNALKEAELQLQQAIKTTTSQIEATYQAALTNQAHARASLAAQETSSLSLDRFGVEYTNLERDFTINEKLLENLLGRMRETSISGTVETQNARLVDRAAPGRKPVSPRVLINLALGVIGGLGMGVALAFFVAYADDRVKSAYDIEVAIGLPLLAIVPRFSATPGSDNAATAFEAPKEPEIAEAFSTLYSSLRLKEEGRNAKCIVVTSTVPGEGKSFITRNLALCFASHGEKVLLVDCDLRRPTAHRGFKVDNLKGVIDVCTQNAPLDEVIQKGIRPNLDLMSSGGRSENPAQNLTSKNFEVMLVELRKRYDRVFIDTPPVSLVSDAFIILPLCDGSIYSIFFNKVRRKAAQFCVQRLLEISVPHFGAVLNGLDQRLGGYYYGHYADKAYKGYYVTSDDKADGTGKLVEPSSTKDRR